MSIGRIPFNIQIFFAFFLLFSAHSHLCMDKSAFEKLEIKYFPFKDDGEKWTEIKAEDDALLFEQKIVAFRYRSGFVHPGAYSITPPTLYGMVERYWRPDGYDLLLAHVGQEKRYHYAVNVLMTGLRFKIRRLKLKEAAALRTLAQEGSRSMRTIMEKIISWEATTMERMTPEQASADSFVFRLSDLTAKEQRHYIHNHSKSVLIFYLMHKKCADSPVSRLPRDLVRMIAQQIVEDELRESSEDVALDFK
jgi:hypothetical protein